MYNAHSALEDARATARLLRHYIQNDDNFVGNWSDIISAAQISNWPSTPEIDIALLPRKNLGSAPRPHFLSPLVSRTPRSELHPEANSYLALLDQILLDGQISLHEEAKLIATANTMGLSMEDATALHKLYLAALGKAALEDGIVTSDEREQLDVAARALGLGALDVDQALAPSTTTSSHNISVSIFKLKQGDTVVFTGEHPIGRGELKYQASTLGLRATSSVSRKTTLVVAADPDSMSGKAREARDLGIPVVDYAGYVRMLDSMHVE